MYSPEENYTRLTTARQPYGKSDPFLKMHSQKSQFNTLFLRIPLWDCLFPLIVLLFVSRSNLSWWKAGTENTILRQLGTEDQNYWEFFLKEGVRICCIQYLCFYLWTCQILNKMETGWFPLKCVKGGSRVTIQTLKYRDTEKFLSHLWPGLKYYGPSI